MLPVLHYDVVIQCRLFDEDALSQLWSKLTVFLNTLKDQSTAQIAYADQGQSKTDNECYHDSSLTINTDILHVGLT